MRLKRLGMWACKQALTWMLLGQGLAFAQNNFETKAANALAAIPDKTDQKSLDNFIEVYFGTQAADAAFTLRYNETKAKQVIEDYNVFINRYGDTVAGQLAVQEVYELYSQRQTAPSLIAFMDKYPGTAQAYAAKLKLHGMLFGLARAIAQDPHQTAVERLSVIDGFIDSNLGAPQIPGAILLAKAVGAEIESSAKEQLKLDTIKKVEAEQSANGSRDLMYRNIMISAALKERANELATHYEVFMDSIDEYLIDETKLKALSRAEAVAVYNRIRQAERAGFVLQTVYPEQDAAARVRTEQRYVKTAKILKSIQDAIFTSNVTLIAAMREEFSKVSHILTDGFGALDSQMRGINSRLDILHSDLDKTNQLLQDVNKNIVIVQQGITDLGSLQTKTNELLDKQINTTAGIGKLIDSDLAVLHDSVLKLNSDLNVNSDEQRKLLLAMTGEVKAGFQQQHLDSLASLQQDRFLHDEVIDQFQDLRTSVDQNFARVVDGLGQIKDGIDHTNSLLIEVNGSLVNIGAQLVDINGQLIQVNGKLVEVNGQLFELRKGQETTNDQLVKVNGQLIDANGHLIDLSNGQAITNNQLGQVNSNLVKVDNRLVQQMDQSAKQHYEALRFSESLNTRLVKNMEQFSNREVDAINSNGNSIRQSLGVINNSINSSSDKLEKAIYTGTNMVAERIDRGVAGLRQTIVEQSDRQVYQLTELRNENRQGFASVSKSVNDFREDFKTFSAESKTFYGQALGKMDQISAQANRSTAVDYQRNINKMLGSLTGEDLKGAAKGVVLNYCGELNVSGEECESIVDKALKGEFDAGQLGSLAGRTLCDRAKVNLDPETCGKLGEMIGQGKFDMSTIAQAGINELCVKSNIKIQGLGCSDIAKAGSVVTDIYSGNWGGAISTVASELGKRTGPPVGQILTQIGSIAGDASIGGVASAVGEVIGSLF